MFATFKQIFMSITVLFLALEKFGKAFEHLASFTEESAESLNLKARLERQAEIRDIKIQLGLVDEVQPLKAVA